MLTYCVPLIPTAVFWWIMGVSDRYLVKWFVGSDANGIYAVAYKIPTILTILATVFMDAWQLSAIAESGDRRAQARFYARVWDAFFSAVCLCAGGIIAFSPLLIRLLPQHLICDLLLQLLHRRRICAPHYFMWQQEIGVFNDTVHKQRDLLEQFTIADSHPQAAGSVAARPAFPDGPLGVDVPEHGRAAISAADMVAELPDSFTFCNSPIPAPCAFGCDRFLIDSVFDDRVKFSIAGVFGVF